MITPLLVPSEYRFINFWVVFKFGTCLHSYVYFSSKSREVRILVKFLIILSYFLTYTVKTNWLGRLNASETTSLNWSF